MGKLITVGVVAAAFFVLLIMVLISGAQVNAGHVGVSSTFGAIDEKQQPLAPGFHMVMPFQTHIESVSVQPQNHQFSEVATASKELQNVYVDGGVNYHVNADQAALVVTEGGVDAVVSKVFNPAFQDYIKEIVPQYGVEDILAHRGDIRDAAKAKLAEKAAPYGLTVDDLFITNISFDKAYTQAIESKQVSQQGLEKAKIDAQTAVTQAQGQAQAQIATAQGEAEANRLRSQYLSPELIQYLEIQKWNGVLPQVSGGGSPLIGLTLK